MRHPPRRFARSLAGLGLLSLALLALAALLTSPRSEAVAGPRGVEARNGMVVSVSAPASEVGLDILKKGGNAVDAAVATAFALAVTYPAAGNIGGGGFMLVYPAGKGEPVVIEYRETAPAAATKTMFRKDDTWYSHKAVGVPGTVRGMALAHQKFGKLPWKDVVMPAVKLADEGFIMDGALASSLNWIVSASADFPELRRVLGKDGGKADWQKGDRLVQKDLAGSLRLIAEQGPDAFYKGPIADKIAAEMKAGGGLITKDDLAAYRANARKPVHGTYRGFDVYGPPPPSSGGTCLVEMLNILENFDLRKQGRWSPETLHLMAEAMRRAYCDRARHLGDSDFVTIPAHLTTKEYARTLARSIDLKHATRSEDLAKDIPLTKESDNTTHFSVIDKNGMAVANTYTLERSYGSRVVVKGAGFVLNNEMIDFNWRPGLTTRDGGIGTEPNQIAPRKRMLSSQTPTVVARDGKVVLVTGSPGSRTIINTVLCIVVNVVDFDMDIRAAVDAPRLHHQWFPDVVRFEGTSDYPDAVAKLRALGHTVQGTRQGDAHSIWVEPKTGVYWGAADRRISGKAAGY
ncbi:MAG TPA: gamma-glutamyltransferase [Gemmataceae bacterium]|nr:gamma-glutamyltransferase [Gemmataceae bacterium]